MAVDQVRSARPSKGVRPIAPGDRDAAATATGGQAMFRLRAIRCLASIVWLDGLQIITMSKNLQESLNNGRNLLRFAEPAASCGRGDPSWLKRRLTR